MTLTNEPRFIEGHVPHFVGLSLPLHWEHSNKARAYPPSALRITREKTANMRNGSEPQQGKQQEDHSIPKSLLQTSNSQGYTVNIQAVADHGC